MCACAHVCSAGSRTDLQSDDVTYVVTLLVKQPADLKRSRGRVSLLHNDITAGSVLKLSEIGILHEYWSFRHFAFSPHQPFFIFLGVY